MDTLSDEDHLYNTQSSSSLDEVPRPICRPVEFHADGQPDGGDYSWSAGNGINGSGKDATYNATTPGMDTITVKYTSPDGTTCDDSMAITSFALNNDFSSNKNCFNSGDSLSFADFVISTTPSGFHDEARLSPTTVETVLQLENKEVAASLLCRPDTNKKYTNITVVNENITVGSGIEVAIPNLLTVPLKKLGLADKLKFSLKDSYKKSKKCCLDGPGDSTKGETAIKAEVALKDFTLYGAPLPKAVKKYFTFMRYRQI